MAPFTSWTARRTFRRGSADPVREDEGRGRGPHDDDIVVVDLDTPGPAIPADRAPLDEGARSATIEAEGDLVCYVMSRTAFELIVREHPTIAVRLLANLGRELSQRLRRANRAIYQLDS